MVTGPAGRGGGPLRPPSGCPGENIIYHNSPLLCTAKFDNNRRQSPANTLITLAYPGIPGCRVNPEAGNSSYLKSLWPGAAGSAGIPDVPRIPGAPGKRGKTLHRVGHCHRHRPTTPVPAAPRATPRPSGPGCAKVCTATPGQACPKRAAQWRLNGTNEGGQAPTCPKEGGGGGNPPPRTHRLLRKLMLPTHFAKAGLPPTTLAETATGGERHPPNRGI